MVSELSHPRREQRENIFENVYSERVLVCLSARFRLFRRVTAYTSSSLAKHPFFEPQPSFEDSATFYLN
jgi:hypothetical protein